MNNGNSTLFKGLSANLLAAILYFAGAVVSFLSGFSGWLGFILIAVAGLLFLIDSNAFVRRACFNILLLFALTLVSWLLFKTIFHWSFFNVINWIIDVAVTLFLIFSGLCALNGKRVDVPFLAGVTDSVCK